MSASNSFLIPEDFPVKTLKNLAENFAFPVSRNLFDSGAINQRKDEESSWNNGSPTLSLDSAKLNRDRSTELSSLKIPSSVHHHDSSKKHKQKIAIDWIRRLCFNPNVDQVDALRHWTRIYKEALYCKYYVSKGLSETVPENKCLTLPTSKKNRFYNKKKTLFFDLEEVLVSLSFDQKDSNFSFTVDLKTKAKSSEIFCKVRPFCSEILNELSEFYDIYVFSALREVLVRKILKRLDPKKQFFKGIFTKTHCHKVAKGTYFKDLRIFMNKSLKEMVLVDRSVYSFACQMDNGICLLPWVSDPNDVELLYLKKFLIELSFCDDVRKEIRRQIGISEIA